jgi:hypothetical protein
LQRLLLGTLAAVHLGLQQAINHRMYRSLAHLGLSKDMDLLRQHRNPRRAGGICRAPVSGNGLPEALPRMGRLRGPNSLGNLATSVAWEELRVGSICEDYPKTQVSRENFVDIQRVIGQLVDELPEEGFTPRLVDSYWSKGVAILVCHDVMTTEWLAAKAPIMEAWEGSRLKAVELDALLTYKRVVAWFLGAMENMERYLSRLHRLNRGLDTRIWRVYKRREEPHGVHLVLSIDTAAITVLEGLGWRPFSGVGQAIFSLLGSKPEGKK